MKIATEDVAILMMNEMRELNVGCDMRNTGSRNERFPKSFTFLKLPFNRIFWKRKNVERSGSDAIENENAVPPRHLLQRFVVSQKILRIIHREEKGRTDAMGTRNGRVKNQRRRRLGSEIAARADRMMSGGRPRSRRRKRRVRSIGTEIDRLPILGMLI